MTEFIEKILAHIRGRAEEAKEQYRKPFPPHLITHQKMSQMVQSLNIERIRRTMMLFDLRWIDEQGNSHIPEEQEIAQEAFKNLSSATMHGRVLGAAESRDKGFTSTYLRLPDGNEILRIHYAVSEASSLN